MSPATLSRLLGRDVGHVEPVNFTPDGWSSTDASFTGLRLDGEQVPSLVMKTVDRARDWVAVGTRDAVDREVQVWELGVLGRLAEPAGHGVIGAARNQGQYALLMRNLSDHLLPDDQVDDRSLGLVIRAMASYQAEFWRSDQIVQPNLGLSTLGLFVGHTSPTTMRRVQDVVGDTAVGDLVAEGRAKLPRLLGRELAETVSGLADFPDPLLAMADHDWWTLAHGDVRPANVAATDDAAIFLDWARPMAAPPGVDLMYWLSAANQQRSEENDRWIEYHRSELEARLDERIDPARWHAQADIAAAMVFTCMAQFMALSEPPSLPWWIDRASHVLDHL